MDGVFMKKLIKLVLGCALVAAFLWFGSVLADRQRLNEDLIRLHVVANSDEAEDQNLKLQVRDAVVESLRTALADVQGLVRSLRTDEDRTAPGTAELPIRRTSRSTAICAIAFLSGWIVLIVGWLYRPSSMSS